MRLTWVLGVLVVIGLAFWALSGEPPTYRQGFDFDDGTRTFATESGATPGELRGHERAGVYGRRLHLTERRDEPMRAAFVLPELDVARQVEAFDVRFRARFVGDPAWAEGGLVLTFGRIPEGAGQSARGFADAKGLSIRFEPKDTHEDPSSIDVMVDGRTIDSAPARLIDAGRACHVCVSWSASRVSVTMDGRVVLRDLDTRSFHPRQGDRVAFSAYTAANGVGIEIDDLAVTTSQESRMRDGGVWITELAPFEPKGEDWVEIHNAEPTSIDLDGFRLYCSGTDGVASLKLPPVRVQPGAFYVLDLAEMGGMPEVGAVLELRDAHSVRDRIRYGMSSPRATFGWIDDPKQLGFLVTRTKGRRNRGTLVERCAPPAVRWSHPGGVVEGTTKLRASAPPDPSAVVRYALGTEVLDAGSPVFPGELVIDRSTTVRAAVFAHDRLPGPVSSRSFVFLGPKVRGFRSTLPVVVLDSAGYDIDAESSFYSKRHYRDVHVSVFGGAGGSSALGERSAHEHHGAMRVRGHSSAVLPKKSYSLELTTETGAPSAAPVLGLAAASKWVLNAAHSDRTLMRNVLAYDLARELLGPGGGMRTRFVELFFDDAGDGVSMADYRGVYVLTERIERGPGRIEIDKRGFVFKQDKGHEWDRHFRSARYRVPLSYVFPNKPKKAQRRRLEEVVAAFEQSISRQAKEHYSERIDVRSFIVQDCLVEAFREIDGWFKSTYYTVDRRGRIRAGPIWDFDLAMGNADRQYGYETSGWFRDLFAQHPWYRRLRRDPGFDRQWWAQYRALRRGPLADAALAGRIDSLARRLAAPAGRNFDRWPILGKRAYPDVPGDLQRATYASEVEHLKEWLVTRLRWIDGQHLAGPLIAVEGDAVHISHPDANAGALYYTTDGSDPAFRGQVTWERLLEVEDLPAWTLVPTEANGGAKLRPSDWTGTAPPPNQSNWVRHDSGAIGYAKEDSALRSMIRSPVKMKGISPSCFVRVPFDLEDLDRVRRSNAIHLRCRADDGFVVYVNGERVAAKHAPAKLDWQSRATHVAYLDVARTWLLFDITDVREHLRERGNVLAVHALNHRLNSSDLMFQAEISIQDPDVVAPRPGSSKYTAPFSRRGVERVRAAWFDGRRWSGTAELQLR